MTAVPISDWLLCNPRRDDPRVAALRRRMDDFYRTSTDYTAFHQPAVKSREWAMMDAAVDAIIASKGHARILELGAGRTAYLQHVATRRKAIEFHCQDVTPVNADYLKHHADRLHVGDISDLDGEYDLIFSTYVLEHVCNPELFLEHVDRLLAPSGWHFTFSPRYDSVFYVCPSLRHQPLRVQAAANVRMALGRMTAAVMRFPRFWINCDPAVLHAPWRRDADAVHLVNRRAIEAWHRQRGYSVQRVTQASHSWKEWLLVRHLLLSNGFQKCRR